MAGAGGRRGDELDSRKHELAKSFVYSWDILFAVERRGDLPPIVLPESYLEEAGRHARARIVAAGMRPGVVIGGEPDKL